MGTAERKRSSRRVKRRSTSGGARRSKAISRDQGGIAALVIALLLGAIGLSQADWAADGRPDARLGDGGTTEERTTDDVDEPAADDARTSEAEDALFAAINSARTARRLPALRASAPLARAARAHSADLQATARCSHDGSDGSSVEDRLTAVDVDLRQHGEIVACGSASAEAAVEQWLGSDAHRDILLGRTFEVVGVGAALGAQGAEARWTAVVGTP